MTILTIPSKSVDFANKTGTTFISPAKLFDFNYRMTPKNDLHKLKDIRVSLSLTLFDKVSNKILTIFEDKPEPKVSICLTRNIHHNLVNKDHLFELLTYNAVRELFERFKLTVEGLEDVILQKLKDQNHSFYIDRKRVDKSLPTLTIGMMLGVCDKTASLIEESNRETNHWLDFDVLRELKERIGMDDDTVVVLMAASALAGHTDMFL